MLLLELLINGLVENRPWIKWQGKLHRGRFQITDFQALRTDWCDVGGASSTADAVRRSIRRYYALQQLRKVDGLDTYQLSTVILARMIRSGQLTATDKEDELEGKITK